MSRPIEDIKADIAHWENEPMDETRAIMLRLLKKELKEAITNGIPLDRLEEICAAYRDGRYVALPCMDNREIYVILDGKIETAFICNISISYSNDDRIVYECLLVHRDHEDCLLSIKQFGKIWFLARESAEAALAQEGEGK